MIICTLNIFYYLELMKVRVPVILLSTFFLFTSVSSYIQCDAYICKKDIKSCTERKGSNVFVNGDACPGNNSSVSKLYIEGKECFISEDSSESHCLTKATIKIPTLLYPGYKCKTNSKTAICAFGPK